MTSPTRPMPTRVTATNAAATRTPSRCLNRGRASSAVTAPRRPSVTASALPTCERPGSPRVILLQGDGPLTERRTPPYCEAMYFKQMLNEDCGCSSYIVASRASHECAVVDAGLDIQPYLAILEDRGLTLRYVIDTHLHADHVSGNRRLSAETGVPVSLHEAADVLFPF